MLGELLKSAPDVTTFAANIVVFFAAVAAAVIGAMSAIKKIKEGWIDTVGTKSSAPEGTLVKTEIIGGLLQEGFGSKVLAGSVEVNTQATNELTDEVRELRNAVCALRDEMRETRHEMQLQRRR